MKKTKTPAQASPGKSAGAQDTSQFDWSQVDTSGFENVQREDLGIPFLGIIQGQSPQIYKPSKDYPAKKIEGAGQGDIFNTLSNTVVYHEGKEPMVFIPCSYDKMFVEWKPRESGGGFVKAHRDSKILDECHRNPKNMDELRNGNIVRTTTYFFGLHVQPDGQRVMCVIGMTGTQLKKARQWLNIMLSLRQEGPKGKFTPPMFSRQYLLSTQVESNNEGSWYGWCVEPGEWLKDPVMIADAIQTAKRAVQTKAALLPAPPADEGEERKDPPYA